MAERAPVASGRLTRGIRAAGLAGGLALAVLVYLVLARFAAELGQAGRATASLGTLMAVWWLTEALPIPATALLPLAGLPLLTAGEIPIQEAATPYADDLIFLYMGGFMIALAMERWELHRRIALRTILLVGTRPPRVVLGFMLASASLSMWISNTATVVMMLPIALSVVRLVRRELERSADPARPREGAPFHFAIALLLGTAYGASIGGIATLIGTPPNGLLAGFVGDTYGRDITVQTWLPVGLSVTLVFLPIAWWVLTRVAFPLRIGSIPGGRSLIRRELDALGPMTGAERRVLAVFLATAACWVGRRWLAAVTICGVEPLAGLSDAGIAITASLVLFLLSAPGEGQRLLDWAQAVKLPWGILVLFGGGLSLAAAVRETGVDRFIGEGVSGLRDVPTLVLVLVIAGLVIFLTEMTSNTATTATFLPIMGAVGEGLGMDPLLLLVPLTLAASCAFMMPVATPPNAIVFGSGEITIPQMCKAGLWLNLIGLVILTVVVYLVAVPALGIGLDRF